jgi:hypothetical protein
VSENDDPSKSVRGARETAGTSVLAEAVVDNEVCSVDADAESVSVNHTNTRVACVARKGLLD